MVTVLLKNCAIVDMKLFQFLNIVKMNIFTEASGSLVSAALIKALKRAELFVISSDVTIPSAFATLPAKLHSQITVQPEIGNLHARREKEVFCWG